MFNPLSALPLQAFGAGGYLDFLLPQPYSMALELTRDGRAFPEHMERFIDDGKYAPLYECGIITQHAIIDLRSPDQQQSIVSPRLKDANLYTVLFSDTFDTANVFCNGARMGQDVLHVRGRAGEETIMSLRSLLPDPAGQ